MTTFTLLCDRCGLSHREAAAFLGRRRDTIKSWSSGRNPTPPAVIEELRLLAARIERAAEQAVAEIQELLTGVPAEIELGLAKTDAEAQRPPINLPCVGAHRALLGLVAARLMVPVRIVPRGSTAATQAAIKAHQAGV